MFHGGVHHVDGGEQLYLVEKTNYILRTSRVNGSVSNLAQLRYMAPLLFVKIYQAFYGPLLGVITHPSSSNQHKNNVDILLAAMRERFNVHFIDEISTTELLEGRIHALEVVVDMFTRKCELIEEAHLRQERRAQLQRSKEEDPRKDDIRKVKDTTNKLKSNRFIKKLYTEQRKQAQKNIPPDVKVLMDRLVVLENLNIEQENSKTGTGAPAAKQKTGGKSKSKAKKKTSKRGRKGSKRDDLTTPLFKGRVPAPCVDIAAARAATTEPPPTSQPNEPMRIAKKESQNDGDNSMDLLYESERQQADEEPQNDGDNSMDLLYESERQQADEPLKSNADLLHEAERQSLHLEEATSLHYENEEDDLSESLKDLVPILSRGKIVCFTSPYEKEPYHYHTSATSPSSRPLPVRPRSATGHNRRSPFSSSRRKLASRRRWGYDDSAVGFSKDGGDKHQDDVPHTYDIHTGRRMPVSEITEMKKTRDEIYHHWKKNYDREHAPPVVPQEAKYPNGTTETSVRQFNEKMNRMLAPPEESVDEVVQYFSVPQHLNIYKLMQQQDIIISVENCCNCEYHKMSTRHKADDYLSRANAALVAIAQFIHDLSPVARVGVIRSDAKVTKKSKQSDTNSRVGAFEIQIAYKDSADSLQFDLLHSKLKSTRWPSKSVIEKRLQAFLVKSNVNFDTRSKETSWDDLYMSHRGWAYAPYDDDDPIDWIFDWRQALQEECTPRSHNITMESPEVDEDHVV